jgi:hypothetical protein
MRLAVPAIFLAGCVADVRGPETDCPRHGVRLHAETLAIVYGLADPDFPRIEAAARDFPFEGRELMGGCIVSPCSPRWARVRVCSRCRAAAREWDRNRR